MTRGEGGPLLFSWNFSLRSYVESQVSLLTQIFTARLFDFDFDLIRLGGAKTDIYMTRKNIFAVYSISIITVCISHESSSGMSEVRRPK